MARPILLPAQLLWPCWWPLCPKAKLPGFHQNSATAAPSWCWWPWGHPCGGAGRAVGWVGCVSLPGECQHKPGSRTSDTNVHPRACSHPSRCASVKSLGLPFPLFLPKAKASGKKLQKVTLKVSPRGIVLNDSSTNELIENISIYRWVWGEMGERSELPSAPLMNPELSSAHGPLGRDSLTWNKLTWCK